MSGKLLGAAVATVVLFALAFGLWYQQRHPRRVLGESQVTVERRTPQGLQRVTLKTREVSIASRRFWEVELPGGTWIDCAGDCRQAVYEAGDGFWEKLARERGTR